MSANWNRRRPCRRPKTITSDLWPLDPPRAPQTRSRRPKASWTAVPSPRPSSSSSRRGRSQADPLYVLLQRCSRPLPCGRRVRLRGRLVARVDGTRPGGGDAGRCRQLVVAIAGRLLTVEHQMPDARIPPGSSSLEGPHTAQPNRSRTLSGRLEELVAGEVGQLVEEPVLEGGVPGGGRDRGRLAVFPHLTGPQGFGVVGGGEPGLGQVALFQ